MYRRKNIKLGVPTSIAVTYSETVSSCPGLSASIQVKPELKAFLENAMNSTMYVGKYANADAVYTKDWVQVPSATDVYSSEVKSSTRENYCEYQKGGTVIIHYSYSLYENKKMYYVFRIERQIAKAEVLISTTAQSIEFGLYVDFAYHDPNAIDPESFEVKYGNGIIGAVNYFFTEVVVPILKPSSVSVS